MEVTGKDRGTEQSADHPVLTRLRHIMRLDAGDCRSLDAIVSREIDVEKRKDLLIAGDEFRNLCFVTDGYAIRYKVLRNGKRQILNVILPGDVLGFTASFFDRSMFSIVAVSRMRYRLCSLDAYAALCHREPQFGLALCWLAAQEAAVYAEHVVNLGRRTPEERLAHFLLEIYARLKIIERAENGHFEMPFSQHIIADVLGLSVPHLNRVLQGLREGRLIATRSGMVEMIDVAGLTKLAQYQPYALTRIPSGSVD